MIEARHLRVLRAVARTGSFSAAARELGCTQPAVSQQMRALEQTAGTPLLVRTGRETRLTEAGAALVRHAAGILAGLTAAEEEVAAIAGLRAGRVRLVSFPSASTTLVPAAVAAMRTDHPGTRVSLVEAEPARSVELLRAGDCDIALTFRYVDSAGPEGPGATGAPAVAGVVAEGPWEGEPPLPGGPWGKDDLVVRPLLTDRLVGLVPEDHRLARAAEEPRTVEMAETTRVRGPSGSSESFGAPETSGSSESFGAGGERASGRGAERAVGLRELAGEPWVAGCPRCRDQLVRICEREGFTPRIDFATDGYPAVAGLVGAGLGVAVLPGLVIGPVRPRGVRTVRLGLDVRREIVALTLPDLVRVPAVAAMLDRLSAAARR